MKAVMTPFPYSIETSTGVTRAREMMAEHDIRHLPVVKQGRLVGVVTDRDIQRALNRSHLLPPRRTLKVGDVCVLEAYTVELTAPLDAVLLEMASRHLDCALVVKGGRLAGIFTVTDACRAFGEFLQGLFPSGDDDSAA